MTGSIILFFDFFVIHIDSLIEWFFHLLVISQSLVCIAPCGTGFGIDALAPQIRAKKNERPLARAQMVNPNQIHTAARLPCETQPSTRYLRRI